MHITSLQVGPIMTNCYLLCDETAQVCALIDPGDDALLGELCRKARTERLRAKTIVDYTREPFVYGPGNVRVTLDEDIRTGLSCVDFLDPDCVTVPAPDARPLMEVKWDAFLPDIIRDAVQLPGRQVGAFSKYAACRMYD